MVQSRFLLSVAVIVVVTVLDHNNCNAGITTKVRDGFINGISTSDLADFDRKNNPIKWLKRQVRKLKKELAKKMLKVSTNTGDISELDGRIKANMLDIEINNEKIEDNEEDISVNDGAIAGNIENINKNSEELENFQNATWNEINDNAAAISNNTADIGKNSEDIENNAKDIDQLEALFEQLNTTAPPPPNPCEDESFQLSSQFDSTARVVDGICLVFPSKEVKKSWSEGQEICQQQNGNIWNQKSKENGLNVAAAFYDIFQDYGTEVFIGLNDLSEEGNWALANGEAVDDQFDWIVVNEWNGTHVNQLQQPDNGGEGGDQDCGMLYFYYGNYYLYDEECNEFRSFICEFVN